MVDEAVARAMEGVAGPEARRALMHRPAMANAVGRFNEAVLASELDPRLHEIVRYRIALINGCVRCQAYRLPDAATVGVDEDLLAEVKSWRRSGRFTDVERAALDYAERFSLDPTSIDDEHVANLCDMLGDAPLVDLTVCIAKYVAIGRLISVLGLDQVCEVGSPVLM